MCLLPPLVWGGTREALRIRTGSRMREKKGLIASGHSSKKGACSCASRTEAEPVIFTHGKKKKPSFSAQYGKYTGIVFCLPRVGCNTISSSFVHPLLQSPRAIFGKYVRRFDRASVCAYDNETLAARRRRKVLLMESPMRPDTTDSGWKNHLEGWGIENGGYSSDEKGEGGGG